MEFRFTRHASGVQIVELRGRVTFGRHTERCREMLKAALADGERRFVFDLANVEYADSAGLGFLVSCLTSVRQAGAELRLVSPPERVIHVLNITRLNTVFHIDAGQQQALAHFAG